MRDRVVQMAAKLVIEPIFEADFQSFSYGFRPKKSATQALEAIRVAGNRGLNFVVDADIQGYFDNIQKDTLMELVKERISDRRVLKLIRQWLECGVMEDGTAVETATIGQEGMVGLPVFLGTDRTAAQAFTQVSGRALRMPVPAFREELARGGALPGLLGRYTQAMITLIAQNSACGVSKSG